METTKQVCFTFETPFPKTSDQTSTSSEQVIWCHNKGCHDNSHCSAPFFRHTRSNIPFRRQGSLCGREGSNKIIKLWNSYGSKKRRLTPRLVAINNFLPIQEKTCIHNLTNLPQICEFRTLFHYYIQKVMLSSMCSVFQCRQWRVHGKGTKREKLEREKYLFNANVFENTTFHYK